MNNLELESLLDTSRPFDEPKVRFLEQIVNQLLDGKPEDVSMRVCLFGCRDGDAIMLLIMFAIEVVVVV